MANLSECLSSFGLSEGISVYLKLRYNRVNELKLKELKHPITMRPRTIDKYTFKEMFILRDYDIDMPKTWKKPQLIIDAGANIGLSSVFFANKYPEAKVIAIEPSEDNYEYLQSNTRHYPNITTLKSALWHQKDTLHVVDRGYGERGYMVEQVTEETATSSFSAVCIQSLQEDFQFTNIDILKIDIEGSEKELFENCDFSWLANTKCLIIELHDRMKENCSKVFFQAITQYDFSFSLKGENLIFFNKAFM